MKAGWIRPALHLLCAGILVAGCSLPGLGQDAPPAILVGENVLVSGGEDFPHVEPHLAVNPTDADNLIGAVMTFPDAARRSRLRVYVSADGGRSWTSHLLDASATSSRSDPHVAFGPDGTAFVSSLPGLVWRSHDGGRTWLGPAALPVGGGALDYPVVAIDSAGILYVAASQAVPGGTAGESAFSVSVFRSDHGGRTFGDPVRLQPNNFNNQSGDILVMPGGGVLVTLHEIAVNGERLSSPRLWTFRSEDGAATFSVPHLVTEGYVSTGPDLAADRSGSPAHGRIYAGWAGLAGSRDNWLTFSDDGGATWDDPVRVSVGPEDRYPTRVQVAVNLDGVVGLSWKEHRPDAGPDCFQLHFTASLDHGRTFLEPVPVAAVASCGSAPGNAVHFNESDRTVGQRWRAGGDYDGLVALEDGSFRALWTDSRTGVFQVWTAPIELRRIPDMEGPG